MNRLTRSAMLFTALAVALSLICSMELPAQTRLSDKDVEQHMKNLKDDAKKFRSSFNSSLLQEHHPKDFTGERREDPRAEFRKADKFDVRNI